MRDCDNTDDVVKTVELEQKLEDLLETAPERLRPVLEAGLSEIEWLIEGENDFVYIGDFYKFVGARLFNQAEMMRDQPQHKS